MTRAGGVVDPFSRVDHRPYPMSPSAWIMAQTWHDLLFAHWPVEPQLVQATLPPGLEVDTFEGRAWIAVVPFQMSGIRARWTPALPWISAFLELNVRTYVKRAGRGGVWFYSLDAERLPAVWTARRWFHLPYFHARMSLAHDGEAVEYASERTHRGAAPAGLRARYEPVGDPFSAPAGSLEHWLTERYCLYAPGSRGTILRGEIRGRVVIDVNK